MIGWLWICVRLAGSGALLGGLLGLLWNVVLLQPPDLRHGVLGLLFGGLLGLVLALVNLLGPISLGRGALPPRMAPPPGPHRASCAVTSPQRPWRAIRRRCWSAVLQAAVAACCATLVPPICSPSPPPAPARASAPCCPTCC
ncbi:hypothetical protein ACFQU7_32810 [Pseudoroseomonas wenyumeiae]